MERGRDGDDGDSPVEDARRARVDGGREGSDAKGGFVPVEDGHLEIHEDDIEAVVDLEESKGDSTVLCDNDSVSVLLEALLDDRPVDRLVLCVPWSAKNRGNAVLELTSTTSTRSGGSRASSGTSAAALYSLACRRGPVGLTTLAMIGTGVASNPGNPWYFLSSDGEAKGVMAMGSELMYSGEDSGGWAEGVLGDVGAGGGGRGESPSESEDVELAAEDESSLGASESMGVVIDCWYALALALASVDDPVEEREGRRLPTVRRRVELDLAVVGSRCEVDMAVMSWSISDGAFDDPTLGRLSFDRFAPMILVTTPLPPALTVCDELVERAPSMGDIELPREGGSRVGRRKGMMRVNLDPWPTLDSTRSCPSRLRTIRATTASPNPIEDVGGELSPMGPVDDTSSNSRKMFSSFSSEIPDPGSVLHIVGVSMRP